MIKNSKSQKRTFTHVSLPALVLLALLFFAFSAPAQAVFNYQGRLTDASNNPITIATTIRFCIATHPTNGDCNTPTIDSNIIWAETYDGSSGPCPQITPDGQGFFNVTIGSCSALPANLNFNTPLYLAVKVGTDSTATPRIQLNPTPMALQVGPAVGTPTELKVLATGTATAGIQGYNSADFILQGSGWDPGTSSAVDRDFTIANEVTSSANYSFVLRNNDDVQTFAVDQSGVGTLTGSAQFVSASSAIAQYKVVKRIDSAIQGIPQVQAAANGDTPLGVVTSTFVQAKTPIVGEYYGSVLYYGRLVYNTTGQSVGDAVYFDNSGSITFAAQNTQIGTVINVGATGAIFIDTITTADINYDPTVLTEVSNNGNYTATDIQIVGQTLYVLTTADFQIFDIQDPANPVQVSLTGQDGYALFVAGKYLYIVNGANGLFIYDIQDPNSPSLVGSLSGAGVLEDSRDIYVSGSIAYIADGNTADGTDENIKLVDVSDPTNPFVLSEITAYTNVGNVSYNALGIFVRGKYAYVAADSEGLIIIDVTDRSNPTYVSQVAAGSNNAKKVYVEGTNAFVADGTNGMRIIDVSDPTIASLTNTVTGSDISDVYVAGGYAFLAGDSSEGLIIVNVSDPTSPTTASSFTAISNNLNAVKIAGRYAYIAESGGGADVGIRIISLGGAEIASAEIASLQAGEVSVIGNIISQGDLYVQDGAVFGGDVFVDEGNLAVEGNVMIRESGSSTSATDPSAILEISSTTQGFLGPRMTTAQRDSIVTPATGLQVFNTTTNQYEYYNGSTWQGLSPASGGLFVGLSTNAWDNTNAIRGYIDADTECDNTYSGSHVCYGSEIINSINGGINFLTTGSPAPLDGDQIWINNGPPAHPSVKSNDCEGWVDDTSSTYGSVYYVGTLTSTGTPNGRDKFLIHPCDQTLFQYACCK